MIATPMHPCLAWNTMRRATLAQLGMLRWVPNPRERPMWAQAEAEYQRAQRLFWRLEARYFRRHCTYAIVQAPGYGGVT